MPSLRSSLTLLEAGDLVLQAADAKAQLYIDGDESYTDDFLNGLIATAQNDVDGRDGCLGRALLTQQWRLTLDRFTDPWSLCSTSCYSNGNYLGEIKIPLPPLQTIDSIKYLDESGVEQTVDPSVYRIIDGGSMPSSLVPKVGLCWPSPILCAPDAVRIEFTAGYEDVASLNAERAQISQAMLLNIGHLFKNREAIADGQPVAIPMGYDDLLAKHRVNFF